MDNVVCSVPYSGTRSLMEYIGVDRYEHFGSSPSFFARDDFIAHIPVRDWQDVARAWAMRNKPLDEMLMRVEAMIKWISENEERCEFYQTETLPIVRGDGEWTKEHASVAEYQAAMTDRVTEVCLGSLDG